MQPEVTTTATLRRRLVDQTAATMALFTDLEDNLWVFRILIGDPGSQTLLSVRPHFNAPDRELTFIPTLPQTVVTATRDNRDGTMAAKFMTTEAPQELLNEQWQTLGWEIVADAQTPDQWIAKKQGHAFSILRSDNQDDTSTLIVLRVVE
ncbi:hypothetical protein [Rosistilla carotiformis]|nr:hypothetical protein [Rosistilla carotiformis]